MKNLLIKIIIIFTLIILVYCYFYPLNFKKKVITAEKHKGVAITLYDSNNNDAWYDENLPRIKKLGAELEVVTEVKIKNENDPNPVNDPKISDKLNRLFRKSKQYGIKVSLIKPHLMTQDKGDSFFRGSYIPSDTNQFFSNWKEIMLYYASVSDYYKIPILSLSCETVHLSENTYILEWNTIIKQVKLANPRVKVTMAFTKSELDRELKYHEQKIKSISNLLDYISLDMYPVLKRESIDKKIKISDDYFVKDNSPYGYVESIKKTKKYFHKNILITETGSTARTDSKNKNIYPINLNPSNPEDHYDQNIWINVILNIFLQMDEVKGVYIWHVGYPFQFFHSKTEETIKELFSKY